MVNPDTYISGQQEQREGEARMDLDAINSLKKRINEMMLETATLLNNGRATGLSHHSIECVLEWIDEAFADVIKYNQAVLNGDIEEERQEWD